MMMPVTSILSRAEKAEQVFLESLLQIHYPAINVACTALWKALEESRGTFFFFLNNSFSFFFDAAPENPCSRG